MADLAADVAVIGAGPAGLAAAAVAAERGKRVIVLDEGPRPGGQIWRHRSRAELPRVAQDWLARFDRSGATLLSGVTVFDAGAEAIVGERAGATVRVHAETAVHCVGAREQFMPFPGWTLPGVVGVGGAQALLKSGYDVRGKRVVIAGSGPLLLPVAAALAQAGALVELVLEQAPLRKLLSFGAGLWRLPGKIAEGVRYRNAFRATRFQTGSWVVRAQGERAVEAVVVTNGQRARSLRCDLLCVSYGLVAATELPRWAGCTLNHFGNVAVDTQQQTSVAGVYCAGEPTGVAGVDAALIEGQIAGYAAAGGAAGRSLHAARDRYRKFAARLRESFNLRDELRSLADENTVVCRCEDVRYGSLAPMNSTREAKLYTRAGMGACQGRICGPALRSMFGWHADTVRVPIAPASLAALVD